MPLNPRTRGHAVMSEERLSEVSFGERFPEGNTIFGRRYLTIGFRIAGWKYIKQ